MKMVTSTDKTVELLRQIKSANNFWLTNGGAEAVAHEVSDSPSAYEAGLIKMNDDIDEALLELGADA